MDFRQYYEHVIFDTGRGLSKPLDATHGDTFSRGMYIFLQENEQRVTDLAGLSMFLTFKRPDGLGDIVFGTIDQGSFRIDFPQGLLEKTGDVSAQLTLSGTEGEIISGRPFFIRVGRTLSAGELEELEESGVLQVLIDFADNILPGIEEAELERIANELGRIAAEQLRVSAEGARQSNESTRVSNESGRTSAEGLRVSAEQGRSSAEGDRVNAEQGRSTAEGLRVTAEQGRANAEGLRVSAENTRLSQESARQSNESGRTTAEGLRVSAEQGRVNAEGIRVNAEQGRVSSEGTRVSAEQGRVSAEGSRVSAEQGRASAEGSRVSAESARNTAEGLRASAELTRISNMEIVEEWIDNPLQFKGETGDSLEYNWSGTQLGVKTDKEQAYNYVNLKGATGDSFQYDWDGTRLGIKTDKEQNYTYVNLKGEIGEGLKILGELSNPSELPSTANIGDAYLINQNLYVWQGTTFVNAGEIKGPKGEDGAQGPQGIQGPQGPPGPDISLASTQPTNGEWWFEPLE